MSGGSFDYFYDRGPAEAERLALVMGEMADRCDEWATEAPDPVGTWEGTTEDDIATLPKVAAHLRKMAADADALAKRMRLLSEVMHDIEWRASGDTGRHQIVESWLKGRMAQTV